MKVVIADYGYRFRCVAVLDDSDNEVDWMNRWLTELEHDGPIGPRVYQFNVQEFDDTTRAPRGLGGAMLYPVNTDQTWYGKVAANDSTT